MKVFCLRLALFLILGTSLVILSPQKALAKNAYGFTWTNPIATPSAVVVDTLDNVYYAGFAASGSADFNPLPTHLPSSDVKTATIGAVFLTKVNSGLSTYGYSYLIEADDPKVVNDKVTSISLTKMATDSANNVFLLGTFNGNVDFDPTAGMDFHSSNGQTWQFLTEIGNDGSYKQTYIWQSPYITLNDLAFDENNNIYVAGRINNTTAGSINVNLDPLTGTAPKTLTNPGDLMAFYTKIDAGNTYGFSKTFTTASPNTLELDHIALDSNNNVFLFGVFSATVTFDGTAGPDASSKTSSGDNDLYLNEFDAGGTYVSTYTIGGTGKEYAGILAIDHDDNIYYSGGFNDTVNFNPTGGTADPKTAAEGIDGQNFLTKLTSDGTAYGYTVTWQTSGLNIEKIAFHDNSLLYLVGESATSNPSIDYNPAGGDPISGFGNNDAFLTVLNSIDGTYNYTDVWGGADDEKATDGAFDSYYDFYVAGSTKSQSINFDPVASTDPETFTGGENGYITQFSFEPYVPPTQPPTDNGNNNNNNSGSSSNSNSGPATCGGSQPSAPSIFQIWATKTTATMHFVPSQGQQDSYTISYGPYNDAETYNVNFSYSDKSGAIPYTINALNPGTTYYFKVRGNNGCMPGGWSNTLGLRTAYAVGVTSKVYASSYVAPYGSTVSGGTNLGGACTQYTVAPGDSFWSIAQKLLGAGGRYFQLWNANKLKFPSLNSSSIIRTGWVLSVGC